MFSEKESSGFRAQLALELIRHKVLVELSKGYSGMLNPEEVNEALVVAGLPLIVPGEDNSKEVNVIKTEKEDE